MTRYTAIKRNTLAITKMLVAHKPELLEENWFQSLLTLLNYAYDDSEVALNYDYHNLLASEIADITGEHLCDLLHIKRRESLNTYLRLALLFPSIDYDASKVSISTVKELFKEYFRSVNKVTPINDPAKVKISASYEELMSTIIEQILSEKGGSRNIQHLMQLSIVGTQYIQLLTGSYPIEPAEACLEDILELAQQSGE